LTKCRDCGVSIDFLLDRCDDCIQKREERLSQQPRDLSVEPVDWKLILKYAAAIVVALYLSRFAYTLMRAGVADDHAVLAVLVFPIVLLIGLTAAAMQVRTERSRHALLIAIIVWFVDGLPVLFYTGFAAFWNYVPIIVVYVLLGLVATVFSFAFVRPEKA